MVHVFTTHPGGVPAMRDISVAEAGEMSRQLQEANISQVQEYLDHTASHLQQDGVETKTTLMEGAPHEELLSYAKENSVDMVTICSHGRGGLRRMLIGSVADKIIRSGEFPVLVIPAD